MTDMTVPTTSHSSVDADLEKAHQQQQRTSVDDTSTLHNMSEPENAATDNVPVNDQEGRDPDLVTWDGPDDPQNPMNWPSSTKWLNIGILSVLSIIT